MPEALRYADGSAVQSDFNRIMSTIFNGASFISQVGGVQGGGGAHAASTVCWEWEGSQRGAGEGGGLSQGVRWV